MKNIILGVSGSISAYKAADIVSDLTKRNFNVDVVLTKGGSNFITSLTLQSLSKNAVHSNIDQEDCPSEIKHIALATKADLLLIAPASASLIGKLASGIADDMLTALVLALPNNVPKLLAPAMNNLMYENPIVQDNLQKLIKYGFIIIEPRESVLACGTFGKGALESVDVIVKKVLKHL